MKAILETLIFVISILAPVSIMLAAAWLIHDGSEGWGWYLLVAVLVVGSMNIHFDGFSK